MNDLSQAIVSNDLNSVLTHINGNHVDINEKIDSIDRSFTTALILATRLNRVEIVNALLQANARVNECDSIRQTAIHVAAAAGHTEILANLLRSPGADLTLLDDSKRSPLALAVLFFKFPAAIALLDAGASPIAQLDVNLQCRAASMSTVMVRRFIDSGINVGALRRADGRSACHLAVADHQCDVALLEMLVNEAGVDLNARDVFDCECLHYSAIAGRDALVRWLLAAGADVDSIDSGGRTPLHNACYSAGNSCVALLLAAGANVHARDFEGRTPAHCLANPFRGAQRAMSSVLDARLLVAAGANLDVRDNEGASARELLSSWTGSDAVDTDLELARRAIAIAQLDFVRARATEVCIGLQPFQLPALQMCEILLHACGPVAPVISFHRWWQFATMVRHFKSID
jgi:ankyrin repeat protein